MKLSRLILIILAVQLLSGLSVFASTPAATERNEIQSLRWKKQVIQIAVSTSLTQPNTNIKTNSDVLGALTRSLEAWGHAANIEFQLVTSDKQNISPIDRFGDGVSLITIAQSPENLLLFARDPFSEAARTRIFYNRRGFITETDIVLNPFQQFSTDGTYGTFDLEKTFAHEIGHLLGLKHSAVMGSLMSDKVDRNTTLKFPGFNLSLLSESDVSAIRDLYGVDDNECCGIVRGKLLLQSGKPARRTVVWAEDNMTGRVIGLAETLADGSYRIGGLNTGEYVIYWQRKEANSPIATGKLGNITTEKNDVQFAAQKLNTIRPEILLSHIGLNMQLGDSAVDVSAGGEYTIVLGGKNINVNSISLEFNSPYLQAENSSIREEDFGDDIDVISFLLKVDEETPAGIYSIFARDKDGRRTAMIGAISVQNTLK